VVDRGLDRQRLRFKLRELKSVVLELDQWPAERFSLRGVADRLQHRAFGHAGAPYSSKSCRLHACGNDIPARNCNHANKKR